MSASLKLLCRRQTNQFKLSVKLMGACPKLCCGRTHDAPDEREVTIVVRELLELAGRRVIHAGRILLRGPSGALGSRPEARSGGARSGRVVTHIVGERAGLRVAGAEKDAAAKERVERERARGCNERRAKVDERRWLQARPGGCEQLADSDRGRYTRGVRLEMNSCSEHRDG